MTPPDEISLPTKNWVCNLTEGPAGFLSGQVLVKFDVKGDGTDVGPCANGLAQEQIGNNGLFGEWTPNNSNHPLFYFDMPQIIDSKGVTNQPVAQWDDFQIDSVISGIGDQQKVRIWYQLCDHTWDHHEDQFTLQAKKTGARQITFTLCAGADGGADGAGDSGEEEDGGGE